MPSVWQRLSGFKKAKKPAPSATDEPLVAPKIPNAEHREQNAAARGLGANNDIFQ